MTIEQINMAATYKGMSQADVVCSIQMTPFNFNQKIKRDTFSKDGPEKIAVALGAAYNAFLSFLTVP